jgi:two-component system OmpR family sensor kinase
MQMKANTLSSHIIHAHMQGKTLSLEEISKDTSLKIGFYDADKKPIVSNIDKNINFSTQFQELDKRLILVDKSAFGHLGVTYTVIEEDGFFEKIWQIKKKIILALLALCLLVGLIGYYLAKLFIKPIQAKRIELNNFIKDSTHELNTPISALLMSIKPQKEMNTKSYERIEISAKRISDIYKDLTYLFLRDNHAQTQNVKDITINKVLKEQVSHLTPFAEKKRVTIIESYHDNIVFKIDEESLIRLFNNLISNAIKYNKLGGTIEVITKNGCVIIKDSGIGIAKEHQKEIYKRFYRATDESGGFGLGLNIVYKICQTYNIDIDMESKEGKGTTFTLKVKN